MAVKAYQNYPLNSWKARFNSLIPVLNPKKKDSSSASTDPSSLSTLPQSTSLEFDLEQAQLVLTHQNLKHATVRLYPINLEVLFSINPKSMDQSKPVSPWVAPAFEKKITLDSSGTTAYLLPKESTTQSLIVEVMSDDFSRVKSYSPKQFSVQVHQHQGLLSIAALKPPHSPLGRSYVKVFRELHSGEVSFHKDGYTDLWGRFDYINAHPMASLSTIRQFYVLILTEKHGAHTQMISPPPH